MIRNITVDELNAIEIAKQKTGNKSACKAVMAATLSFERMAKIVENLQEENNRLRTENRKLKLCISCVTEAANNISSMLGDPIETEQQPKKRKRKT